ncbi:MAG: CvpA family protein [Candidatus Dormibacteraeota bacterium]|nr:CvpA family protein [Candidatus Dormibacteraeota bacterium]
MFFDAVIVLYVLLNLFLGFRYGLFRRVIQVGAFLLGMLLAQALSPGFSEQFGYNTGPHPASAHFGVFLAILFGMILVAEVLGFAYADALGFMNSLLGDRVFGAVLGTVAAILQLAAILYLFGQLVNTQLPSGGSQAEIINSSQDQVAQSVLVKQVKKTQRLSLFLVRPVLPPEPATYFAKTFS